MAVIEPFLMKRVTSGSISLKEVAKALLIKDVRVLNPAAASDYVTITIDGTAMNVIPVHLLPYKVYGDSFKNLWEYVREKIPELPNIKVLAGEELTVSSSGTFDVLEMIYETHDPGDFRPGEAGTKTSDTQLFCVTAYNSSAISASGWNTFDAQLEPTITPDYPVLARIPANRLIQIAGIAVYNTVSGSTTATYLRIWDEEKVLFDPDKNGFLIDASKANMLDPYATITRQNGSQSAVMFFRFDEPWVLTPQAKYTFEYYVSYDGTNAFPARGIMMTLVGLIKPIR